jgi:plasmid segregation protein ParM
LNTRYNEYPFSAANLAVITDALRRAVPQNEMVHVMTGVPFSHFYTADGGPRTSDLTRKVNALLRPVRDVTGATVPQIVKVNVVPQALAGWFDYAIDDYYRIDDERYSECTAIVDIGGRTIDVAVVKSGVVEFALSGTQDLGTLELSAAVHRVIEENVPGIPRRSHNFIERSIRCGIVRIDEREIDIHSVLEREKEELLNRITDYLGGLLGRYLSDIQRVLWIGGGSSLLESHLRRHLPKSEFVEDPAFSNARGMRKYKLHSDWEKYANTLGSSQGESDEFSDSMETPAR